MYEKTIKELKQSLSLVLKPHTPQTATPFIWGKPGIGKSDAVRQICQELTEQTGEEYQFIDLRLSQLESSDLRGIPVPDLDRGIARWLPPEFLPFEGVEQYKNTRGILLLDEINRARTDVIQAAFQLVLDRKVGLHSLLDSWFIVAAGNLGLEDNTDVNEFDSALNNRFIHFRVKEHLGSWLEWARKVGLHEDVVNFIEGKTSFLYHETKKDENVFVTPRSWEKFSDILNANPDVDPIEIASSLGASIINGAAGEFIKYLESKEIVSSQDVIEKYTNKNKKGELILKKKIDALTRDQVYSLNVDVVSDLAKTYTEKLGKTKKDKILGNIYHYVKDVLDRDMYIAFMQNLTKACNDKNSPFIDDYLEKYEDEAELIVQTISSTRN